MRILLPVIVAALIPAGAPARTPAANAEIQAWFECARRVETTPPGLRITHTDAEGAIHYAVPPGLRVFGQRPILLTSRERLRHAEVRRRPEALIEAVNRRWPDATVQGHPDLWDFHLPGGWAVTLSQRSRFVNGVRHRLRGASITCGDE